MPEGDLNPYEEIKKKFTGKGNYIDKYRNCIMCFPFLYLISDLKDNFMKQYL